jgi:hypothetical protein
MPPLIAASDIDLSGNDLLGPIPEAWGGRTRTDAVGAGFNSLKIADNPRMCGALPVWFNNRFYGVPTLVAQWHNGAWAVPFPGGGLWAPALGWGRTCCRCSRPPADVENKPLAPPVSLPRPPHPRHQDAVALLPAVRALHAGGA